MLFLAAIVAGYSQMQNNGGTITIENGATLVIQGNYTSTNAGSIEIDGSVQLKGDFVNNGGNIHSGSTGTLTFNGTAAQAISGSVPTDFYCAVVVDNDGTGVSLTGADAVLYNALTLTDGKFTLNAYDLTMAAAGITANATNYVVTNDVGELKANVAAADVTYPVGDGTTYNPVVLNNTGGTADTYGVIFTGGMPSGWTGGTDNAVSGHWTVSEAVLGGSNLDVTTQWIGTQEQPSFDRTNCAVGVSQDLGATVTWATSGAADGLDPYTMLGEDFSDVGTFVVGDDFFLAITLNLGVILAGPYNGSTMSTALRTQDLIPLEDPYGTNTEVTSIPSNVVDWVLVEFRNKLNAAQVLYSRAFFLSSTGQLLNPADGAVGGKITGVPKDEYYLAIRHRNHLGAMTLNTVNLASGSASFDFSSPAAPLYGTNPVWDWWGTGVMTLWAGDATQTGTVEYNTGTSDVDLITFAVYFDPGNTDFESFYIVPNVYDPADCNLSGTIEYNTGSSDVDPITSSVYFHPENTDFESFFVVEQQIP